MKQDRTCHYHECRMKLCASYHRHIIDIQCLQWAGRSVEGRDWVDMSRGGSIQKIMYQSNDIVSSMSISFSCLACEVIMLVQLSKGIHLGERRGWNPYLLNWNYHNMDVVHRFKYIDVNYTRDILSPTIYSKSKSVSFTMESQLAVLINIVNEIKWRDTGFHYMAIPCQEWQVSIADICHPCQAI